MKQPGPFYRIWFSAFAVLLLAGCSGPAGPGSQKVKRDPNLLLVYAACSLAPTVEAARDQFVAANAGKSVEIQMAEPLALTKRIEEGEVPDILVCVGDAEIGMMERAGYLDGGSRTAMGPLRLAVAVPRGNPAKIASPNDLTTERIRTIAMSTPGVTSLGANGKHELERSGLWDKIQAKMQLQETPDAALEKLVKGEVQAAVIYDPCPRLAAPDGPGEALEIACSLSADEEPVTRIYAVVHKRSPNALLAQRLLRILSEQPLPGTPPIPQDQQVK